MEHDLTWQAASAADFGNLVARTFKHMGFAVELCLPDDEGVTRGADLVVAYPERINHRVSLRAEYVEEQVVDGRACLEPVGAQSVWDLACALKGRGTPEGWIVSNGRFSKAAQDLAQDNAIMLIDGDTLLEIQRHLQAGGDPDAVVDELLSESGFYDPIPMTDGGPHPVNGLPELGSVASQGVPTTVPPDAGAPVAHGVGATSILKEDGGAPGIQAGDLSAQSWGDITTALNDDATYGRDPHAATPDVARTPRPAEVFSHAWQMDARDYARPTPLRDEVPPLEQSWQVDAADAISRQAESDRRWRRRDDVAGKVLRRLAKVAIIGLLAVAAVIALGLAFEQIPFESIANEQLANLGTAVQSGLSSFSHAIVDAIA